MITDIDRAVENLVFVIKESTPPQTERLRMQKTRLEKFWCWLVWGHLNDGAGVCERCGKKLKA